MPTHDNLQTQTPHRSTHDFVHAVRALVRRRTVRVLGAGVLGHRHDGHRHVGAHHVRIGHAHEQHQRHEVPGAPPCCGWDEETEGNG